MKKNKIQGCRKTNLTNVPGCLKFLIDSVGVYVSCCRVNIDNCPPIAPMSPRTSALTRQKSYLDGEGTSSGKVETVEIEDRDHVRPQNLLRPTKSQNSTSFIGPLGDFCL